MNEWKNTKDVLQWFSKIENKKSCSFVQIDIKDFYPSISREILNKALSFSKQHVSISEKDIRTMFHSKRSLLFSNSIPADCFDVTMGSYDGAEICELLSLFILNQLSNIANKEDVGLYRDDGLMILRDVNSRD